MSRTAVLFDLDGTLWDTAAQVAPAWQRLLEPYGVTVTPQVTAGLMGKTAAQIAAALLPGLPPAGALQLVDQCCREELYDLRVTGGSLYPALRETLAALRSRHLLALVSNCQDGYAQTFLDRHGLWPLISDYEMSGRTGLTKGRNIRLVMARNRVERAVFVGDTAGDQAAAREAGVPFLHAAYGFGSLPAGDAPRGVLHALGQLPALLEALNLP